MNGYELSRNWFDFQFENPSKVTASHGMLYLFLCEINNRMGWCEEFQITAKECMQGMSCHSYNTYKKCLDDLIEFGFIILVRKSSNQWQTNIIALSKNDKSLDKALDKALIKHSTNQSESIIQSIGDIHKQQTTNQEPKTINNSFSKKKKKLTIESYLEKNKEELAIIFKDHITIKKHAMKWLEYKFKSKGYKETGWAKKMVERINSTSEVFIKNRIDETIDNETGYEDYFYANHQTEFNKSISKTSQSNVQSKIGKTRFLSTEELRKL